MLTLLIAYSAYMLVLGIESSCDDTSVALLDCSEQGHFVLSEKTASQIDIHKKYGGVVPEIAGRKHAEKIVPLIEEVLGEQTERNRPDVIAVTAGPGLITGLIVGVEAARTLSYAWDIPLVATNHLSGHIHSVEIPYSKDQTPVASSPIQFPALALLVSGGHTELVFMKDHTTFERLGHTVDDAAGECFDKVAKLLGFPYPGGPHISKQGVNGNAKAISFPRPMLDQENYNFSFAGLKTSALYWLRDHGLNEENKNWNVGTGLQLPDFCASFEQAIVDVLVGKTVRAAKHYQLKTVILSGGVAANARLRETLRTELTQTLPHVIFQVPALKYCMDNGAMIAVAGYYLAKEQKYTRWQDIGADPNWKIDGTLTPRQ